MKDILRTIIGRLLAAPLAWLAAFLGVGNMSELSEPVLTLITLVLYGVLHKLLDSRLNPGDVALSTPRPAPTARKKKAAK